MGVGSDKAEDGQGARTWRCKVLTFFLTHTTIYCYKIGTYLFFSPINFIGVL